MAARLNSLQVLRGIAACNVVLFHATSKAFNDDAGTFYWGAAGVDLFFVISGYIIGSIAPGQKPSEFLLRRMWRIYPMWWIAMLPWVLATGATSLPVNTSLWPIWDGQFMLPQPQIGWTLCFEMLFYIGSTLALITRPSIPLALFGAALILGSFAESAALDFLGNPIIFEFLFGLALTKLPRDQRLGPWLIPAGLLAIAIAPTGFFQSATAIDPSLAPFRAVFWGLPCAMIVFGILSLEHHFDNWRAPVLIGDASYSIYLFHVIATSVWPGPWWAKAVVAIAIGLAAYWYIERRLLRVRPALLSTKQVSGAVTADRDCQLAPPDAPVNKSAR